MGNNRDYGPPTDAERGINQPGVGTETTPTGSTSGASGAQLGTSASGATGVTETPLTPPPTPKPSESVFQPDGSYDPYARAEIYAAADAAKQGSSASGTGSAAGGQYGQSGSTGSEAGGQYGQSGSTGSTGGGQYGQPGSAGNMGVGSNGQPGGGNNGQPSGMKYSNQNPIMENGKPVKNNYVVRMVLGILSICSGLMCNIVSVILGVIGVVYTSQANKAYEKGDLKEYKAKAQKADTLVGVATIIFALVLVFWITIVVEVADYGHDDQVDIDYTESVDDDDDDDYDYISRDFVYNPLLDDYTTVVIEGMTLTLPCQVGDVTTAGFTLEDGVESEELDPHDGWYYNIYTDAERLNEVAWLYAENNTNSPCVVADAGVNSILLLKNFTDVPADIEVAGGINWYSTVDDIRNILGDPEEEYVSYYSDGSIDYAYYTYYAGQDMNYSNYIRFEYYEGELAEIDICVE